jgi:hypothetical protein
MALSCTANTPPHPPAARRLTRSFPRPTFKSNPLSCQGQCREDHRPHGCSRLMSLFLHGAALRGERVASPALLCQFLVGASRRCISQLFGRGFAAGVHGRSSSALGALCVRQLPQVFGTRADSLRRSTWPAMPSCLSSASWARRHASTRSSASTTRASPSVKRKLIPGPRSGPSCGRISMPNGRDQFKRSGRQPGADWPNYKRSLVWRVQCHGP